MAPQSCLRRARHWPPHLLCSLAVVLASLGNSRHVGAPVNITGIDVSHWQGTINWTSVANAGYKFAFMKATQDTNYTDPTFATNIANATAAGLIVGPYHFCSLDTNSADPV